MRLIDAEAIDYEDYWYNKGYSIRDCQKALQLMSEQPTIEVDKHESIKRLLSYILGGILFSLFACGGAIIMGIIAKYI